MNLVILLKSYILIYTVHNYALLTQMLGSFRGTFELLTNEFVEIPDIG